MSFLTHTSSFGELAYFNTPYIHLFDDKFCCWIIVFTFTATLGVSLGKDAVTFQEEMQVRSPPPFISCKAAHKTHHSGLNPPVLGICGHFPS